MSSWPPAMRPRTPHWRTFDTIVDVGLADHDRSAAAARERHRRRAAMLVDARSLGADHLVLVSSAMVYGAYANNPVPLTEDAVLRPDVDFVYARQLAAVEETGRRVAARPTRARRSRCCGRWWRWPPTARRRWPRALAAGFGQRFGEDDPAGPVPAPRRPRVGGGARRRTAPRRRVQRRARRWVAGERVRALSGQRRDCRLPDRARRRRGRRAVAVPAWPDPARPAQLHPRAVAGRQRRLRGRGLGRRRSPTSRPTSRAPRPSGGRWSPRSAARSSTLGAIGVAGGSRVLVGDAHRPALVAPASLVA